MSGVPAPLDDDGKQGFGLGLGDAQAHNSIIKGVLESGKVPALLAESASNGLIDGTTAPAANAADVGGFSGAEAAAGGHDGSP